MTINMSQNGTTLEIALEGRLDTASAPELEDALKGKLSDCDALVFDFTKVDYISSAGLRVLLMAHQGLRYGGTTKVKNASEIVKAVFSITGFDSILDIE